MDRGHENGGGSGTSNETQTMTIMMDVPSLIAMVVVAAAMVTVVIMATTTGGGEYTGDHKAELSWRRCQLRFSLYGFGMCSINKYFKKMYFSQ